jgi:hypothetical protein
MAYNDDSVRAKLSALNETQEGIVTVAQWVMFHRQVLPGLDTQWLGIRFTNSVIRNIGAMQIVLCSSGYKNFETPPRTRS